MKHPEELRGLGYDVIGVSGGIVYDGLKCHVFHSIASDIRPASDPDMSLADYVDAFIVDVADTMSRGRRR